MGYGESVASGLGLLGLRKEILDECVKVTHPPPLLMTRLAWMKLSCFGFPTMHPEPRGGVEELARGGYNLAGQVLELDAEERKLHATLDAGVDALSSYAYGSSEVVTESPRGSSRRTDNCELEHVVCAGTLEERNAGWLKGTYSRDEVTKCLAEPVWFRGALAFTISCPIKSTAKT
jgi:hypothetical protein